MLKTLSGQIEENLEWQSKEFGVHSINRREIGKNWGLMDKSIINFPVYKGKDMYKIHIHTKWVVTEICEPTRPQMYATVIFPLGIDSLV